MIKTRMHFAAVLLLGLATTPIAMVAASPERSERAKELGKRVMCMCGSCTEAAGQCSHPGSAFSGPCEGAQGILKEIDVAVTRGDSDEAILKAFEAEYGPAVLAEPPNHGFNRAALLIPVLTLTAGLGLVLLVVARWRKRTGTAAASAANAAQVSPDMLARARERIEREAGE